MIRPNLLLRLLYINWVLAKHQLDEIIFAIHLLRPFRFVLYLLPWHWFRKPKQARGVRLRKALEDLGPIFVKFGQILSTRRDLLPDDLSDELAKLQDQVPPFGGNSAKQIIEQAYGASLADTFARFDEQPLASASIAQVHSAALKDGSEVVIKVVRPGIAKTIDRDVQLLRYIASLAERYWKQARRLHPCELVEEFRNHIFEELDLLREAANATQLRRNFHNSPMLYVPEIYWPYARPNVMVMERIHGIPVNDITLLKHHQIDLKKLAANGVEIFFTQVFQDNFFHADMHPGNIFVGPNGQYIAIDFGIMGTLSANDQRYLAENFLAFFKRDYNRVAELHVQSGWVPAKTRVDEFESAIRAVCEPIFEKPLKDISFGQLLLRLFQTARRFDMEVQPQLVLLQKTLLNIEGLGKQLYPELNLWETAKPFLEQWMNNQMGYRAFLRNLKQTMPTLAESLPELPKLVHDLLRQAHEGKLQVQWKSDELVNIRNEIRRANQRTFFAITGASLVISATILVGLDGYAPRMFANAPFLSWVLGIAGAILLISAWPQGGNDAS